MTASRLPTSARSMASSAADSTVRNGAGMTVSAMA
jgi:hypothetical protein